MVSLGIETCLELSSSQAVQNNPMHDQIVISQNYHLDIPNISNIITQIQGGITCGAIDEPRKTSKAIDERVIINFCDKNVVNARFRDKNGVFIF